MDTVVGKLRHSNTHTQRWCGFVGLANNVCPLALDTNPLQTFYITYGRKTDLSRSVVFRESRPCFGEEPVNVGFAVCLKG